MIYAIVMAGGRGTRLKVNVEKPLFKLHGKPLIKYVLDNISSSKLVEDVVIAVSPHTQETIKYLKSLNGCLLYTSPSPRDKRQSRMPSSA